MRECLLKRTISVALASTDPPAETNPVVVLAGSDVDADTDSEIYLGGTY